MLLVQWYGKTKYKYANAYGYNYHITSRKKEDIGKMHSILFKV